MGYKDFEICKSIVRNKADKLRGDIKKLNDVDCLIGEDATLDKKIDILNTIFALQFAESEILDEMKKKQERIRSGDNKEWIASLTEDQKRDIMEYWESLK